MSDRINPVLGLCLLLMAGSGESALAEDTLNGTLGGLGEFFQLNEKLPAAVCDRSVISRPPTLESTRDGAGAPKEGVLPLIKAYSTRMDVPSTNLLRFLLEDGRVLLAQPRLLSLWEMARGTGGLEELKHRISLEVCTTQVTPGRVQGLLDRKPDLFLPLKEEAPGKRTAAGDGGSSVTLRLRDVDDRFGKIRDRWWVAGWIEPYEVLSAAEGPREYVRLAHPITNQTRFIQVQASDGIPVGFLYLASEKPVMDWPSLRAQAESPANRRKRIEAYLLMVEIAAYEALNRVPKAADSIRDLQEFYKSLLGAYQIYPDDARFSSYVKGAKALVSDASIDKVLGSDFFETLRGLEVNGSRVAFSYFKPDPRLHAIYGEYLSRLSKL